jgi:hypothetical protein
MYTYIDSLYLSISTTKKNLPNELEDEAAAGGAPRAHRLRLHALAQTESNNAMQNGRGKGHFASRTVAAEAKQNIRSPTAVMQTMQAKKKVQPLSRPPPHLPFPSLNLDLPPRRPLPFVSGWPTLSVSGQRRGCRARPPGRCRRRRSALS